MTRRRLLGQLGMLGLAAGTVSLGVACRAAPAAQPTTASAPAKPTSLPAAKPTAAPAKPTTAPTVATKTTKLSVATGAASAVTAPIYMAVDQGFFQKYGLELDFVQLTGGSQVAQALAGGSLQISSGGMGAMLETVLKDAGVKIVGTLYPWHFFQIYSQPEIKTPQELRGKTIAGSSPGASSDIAIVETMEKYQMQPDKDYNITYVGGTRERVLALQQKIADAAIISPPNGLVAAKSGFNKVVDLIEQKIPFGYSGIGANQKFANENPEIMVNYFKAYAEGMATAKTSKSLAKQTLAKWLNVKDDDVLEESYTVSVARMPLLPYTDTALVKKMLSLSKSAEAKTADPEKLYDNSYIKQVEDSGFLKTLPGGGA